MSWYILLQNGLQQSSSVHSESRGREGGGRGCGDNKIRCHFTSSRLKISQPSWGHGAVLSFHGRRTKGKFFFKEFTALLQVSAMLPCCFVLLLVYISVHIRLYPWLPILSVNVERKGVSGLYLSLRISSVPVRLHWRFIPISACSNLMAQSEKQRNSGLLSDHLFAMNSSVKTTSICRLTWTGSLPSLTPGCLLAGYRRMHHTEGFIFFLRCLCPLPFC